jgi:hypothetical protein
VAETDVFKHSTPDLYDRYVGPLLFAPYAEHVARRVSVFRGETGAGVLEPRLCHEPDSDGRSCACPASAGPSGTTPGTVQDPTAENSDDSPAGGIECDHTGQHECEDHQGCTAFPGAVDPGVCECSDADEKRHGEDDPAGLGEPKPAPEPAPVAPDFRHTRSVRRRNDGGRPIAQRRATKTYSRLSSSSGSRANPP